MRTRSHTTVVLAYDEVELLDAAGPISVLTRVGRQWNWRAFKIIMVSASGAPVRTTNQVTLPTDTDLASCPEPELLIVPGGYGARRAARDEAVCSWLAGGFAAATKVLAIGNGVLPLLASGVAEGLQLSARGALRRELEDEGRGAQLSSDRVADSGKLLSAAASGAAVEAALEAVATIVNVKLALGVASELDLAWQPLEDNRIRVF